MLSVSRLLVHPKTCNRCSAEAAMGKLIVVDTAAELLRFLLTS